MFIKAHPEFLQVCYKPSLHGQFAWHEHHPIPGHASDMDTDDGCLLHGQEEEEKHRRGPTGDKKSDIR